MLRKRDALFPNNQTFIPTKKIMMLKGSWSFLFDVLQKSNDLGHILWSFL